MYSFACSIVNNKPKLIVINKLVIVSLCFPTIILLCAQVILIPEDNKIRVLRKGKPHGFRISIPCGGHTAPMCIDGIRLK